VGPLLNRLRTAHKDRLSYIAYLEMLRHSKVERTLDVREKSLPEYLAYVQSLYNYLVSFFERALPLIDIQAKVKEEEANFASAWDAGQVSGWAESSTKPKPAAAVNGSGIWCPYCTSDESESAEIYAEPASGQKHYSKQTVYDAHLSSDKHKKKESLGNARSDPNKAKGPPAPTSSSSSRDKLRIPAQISYLVASLLTYPPIPQLLADTRSEVERRMALTAREREAELEEADDAAPPAAEMTPEEDEEEEDGKIYNPLKLPLGWDGKPIPFWLYKLHGLGVDFRCEVSCS